MGLLKRHNQRNSLGNRIGRGLVPGGRGFFNRPRIPGTRHRIGRHGGHGGHGGGHLLLLPLHALLLGLGMLARLFKHHAKRAARHGVGRHQRARHPRQRRPRIDRPRLHEVPSGAKGRKSSAHRKAQHYFTGVYNVANRHLKRTKLL